MGMSNCLYCYQNLESNFNDFHPQCAKKLFGSQQAPNIDFNLDEIQELGKQIIIKSQAITGVQPKLSIQLEKHKSTPSKLTIVGLYGDYILKPPSEEYAELPENEDLTMHLANLIQITTAKHTLIRLKSGELAYLTKRFDRANGNKIAVEDFCQLSENLTEHKYRGSIEKIGKIAYSHNTNKGYEAQKLFELVLFCFLTGNTDMHLKNFSLIENNSGEYEFSPAYDLLNTSIAIPQDKEETALTINGKKRKLKIEDFNSLAKTLQINEKFIDKIYKKFENAIPNWNLFIENSFLSIEKKQNYIHTIHLKYNQLIGK